MQFGQSSVGSVGFGQKLLHSVGVPYVTPDSIAKNHTAAAYKVEFAWQGNLTQLVNSSGVSVASVISESAQDAGFPASNLISGSDVHINVLTDLDNNWWGAKNPVLPANAVVDLGSVLSFNEVQIYIHPLKPTTSSMALQVSSDNVTYFPVWSQDQITARKLVIPLPQQTARYIKLVVNTVGADNVLRVVSLKVYNWTDETANVLTTGASPNVQPMVNTDVKSDFSQNSLSTMSECDITLDNSSARFSPTNSASPIYGILCPDGRGSGIRFGVPVRVTASMSSAGGSYSKKIFYGIVENDDSAAGSAGIQLDEVNKTASVICKSIGTRLDNTVNLPAYHSYSFDQMIRNICWRCGIADQDVNSSALSCQGQEWAAFSQNSGLSAVKNLTDALPYMRIYETYDPYPTLNFINFGRSRRDLDCSRVTAGDQMNLMFMQEQAVALAWTVVGNNFYSARWDMRQPFDSLSLFANPVPMVNASGMGALNPFLDINGYFYFYNSQTGNIFYANPAGINPSPILVGSISSVFSGLLGTGSLTTFIFGNFIYFFWTTGGNLVAGVWDTTTPITSARSLGTVATGNTLLWRVDVDSTYAVFTALTGSPTATSTVYVWQHNGTPLTTAFSVHPFNPSVTTTANTQNLTAPGTSLIDQAHNYWFYDASTMNLYSVSLAAIVAGSGSRVLAGNVSSVVGNSQNSGSSLMTWGLSGTYLYTVNPVLSGSTFACNVGVWDTTKAFSKFTFLSASSNVAGSFSLLGPDFFGAIWFSTASANASYTSFLVQNTAQWPSTAAYQFGLMDGFTGQIIMADGNPSGNRVQVFGDQQEQGVQSNVFTIPETLLAFPGASPQFVFDLQVSDRGYGDSLTTNRYLNLGGQQVTGTSIGANTVITVANTFNLANGMQILVTNNSGTQELWTVTSFTSTTITFGNITTGKTYTLVSWQNNGIIFDDPTITQYLSPTAAGPNSGTPCTFFCLADVGYLNVNNSSGTSTVPVSGVVVGFTIGQPSTSPLLYDVTNATSKKIYGGQEFLNVVDSPYFNDPSMYLDILNNGIYAKLYLQELDLPWYPWSACEDVIGITDPNWNLSNSLFEVVEVSHKGFATTLAAKAVQQVYNI